MSANTVWQRLLSFFPEVVKGNSGAAPAVDWTAGSVQSITLNAATVTPTFTAPPGGASLALVVTQDGVGGRAVTWPAAVEWIGGTAPILLSGAAQTTLVYFYFDGTTYWGSLQSGASPASIIPWTPVAAGTALAASLAKPNLAADSSGAQSTITLPTAAAMAASNGYEFTIKATGAMVAPIIVAAGAGTTIELLNAPGTFGASTWLPIQGQGVVFKYDLATTTWKVRASSEGSGNPGSSAYNPTWYAQTNVYWDPQAGVDSASGHLGAPVATFAEIVRRYGTSLPVFNYAQSVTINQLTAQNAGVDPVFFAPRVSGGGQAVLLVTLTVKTAAFVGGAVTAKNQATGTRLAVAGFPAGTAANDYVLNQTRNSYAFVDTGGATPVFSNPQPAATVTTPGIPTLNEDNTWAGGDTYVVYNLVNTNLKLWRPVSGDLSGAGNATASCGWVQWADIPDTSGAGASVLLHHNESAVNVLSGCIVRPRCHMGSIGGRGFSTYMVGCVALQAILAFGSNVIIYGGITRGSVTNDGGVFGLDGGVLMHGSVSLGSGFINIGDVFSDSAWTITGGCFARFQASTGGAAAVWGTATVDTQAGSTFARQTGASWVAVWLAGAMKLDSIATGSTYTGAGVMADGVNVTPGNIDAGGAGGAGIFNPRTGARYCNAP